MKEIAGNLDDSLFLQQLVDFKLWLLVQDRQSLQAKSLDHIITTDHNEVVISDGNGVLLRCGNINNLRFLLADLTSNRVLHIKRINFNFGWHFNNLRVAFNAAHRQGLLLIVTK